MGCFAKFKDRLVPNTTSYTLGSGYQTMRLDIPRTRHLESIELVYCPANNYSFGLAVFRAFALVQPG